MSDTSLDLFLQKLLAAPKAKQSAAILSALAVIDFKKPPPDQLLFGGREAAKYLSISYQSIWRLVRAGTLKPVVISGLKIPKYRRTDLEKLAEVKP